jgi:hypothetical protein
VESVGSTRISKVRRTVDSDDLILTSNTEVKKRSNTT